MKPVAPLYELCVGERFDITNMAFSDLLKATAKQVTTGPGSELVDIQLNLSDVTGSPWLTNVSVQTKEGNAATPMELGSQRGTVFPFHCMISKADVSELRPGKTKICRKGRDFIVKAILFEDDSTWEVYCAR